MASGERRELSFDKIEVTPGCRTVKAFKSGVLIAEATASEPWDGGSTLSVSGLDLRLVVNRPLSDT